PSLRQPPDGPPVGSWSRSGDGIGRASLSTSEEPGVIKAGVAAGLDVTGRDRMSRNVLTSWGAHFVFLVAGFLMPRLIDHHFGQAELGIWDFSWSVVNYFWLAQVGVGASVSHYVAKHRAVGDVAAVRRAVSSIM